ncbi:MAG: late competence development ComFB family protein [Treponema sp.]|jgi:competence protein ComFB|nr:late competence development ComFB family protein [Treponema sp.]
MFTEIYNAVEDIVFDHVTEIGNSLEKTKKGELCTCRQCRIDTACYVLNRIKPHYISSNRGVARVEQATIARQQQTAEIVSLIYEGIRQVNHNRRPFIDHGSRKVDPETVLNTPIFSIPIIIGRVFNGRNFEPLPEAAVELFQNGNLVAMKGAAWQNPFIIVPNTEGTFTFWPTFIPAETAAVNKIFDFSVKVAAPNLETLTHFFKIPVTSEIQTTDACLMKRSFKLPNLYLFPEGGEDEF